MSKVSTRDKSKDPNYQQMAIYVTNEEHQQLKLIGAYRGESIRDVASVVVSEFIQKEYGIFLEEQHKEYQRQYQNQYNEEIVAEQR